MVFIALNCLMRKILVLLSLLFIHGFAEAQVANIKSLKGAWKEVGRSQSGKKMAFSDTLFFEVVSSNLCIWGKSSPTAPRLRLKQIGTTLMIGTNEYDILEQQDNRLRLSGDEGLEIEMQKYSNKRVPPVRTANTNNLKFKPAPAVKMGTVPDKIEPFVGVWKCYKRTSVKPIQNEQKYRLLRLVEVEEKDEAITAKMYGFEDLDGKPSWIVQDYSKGILFTSGKDDRPFKVINCQANELIIENEGIVYYMNKLQQ
jgi:hypothetical protein